MPTFTKREALATVFPLISVVIPTYNQASFLPASLNSVLQQTYSFLDILVIDDGSTDATAAICQSYATQDQRLRWLSQSNRGPSVARNRGIAQSLGSYICLLDGDDIMDPCRIAYQYEAFQEDPQIDIVYTALSLIDKEGHPLGEMHGQDYSPQEFLAHMFFRNVIPGPSTIMAKRHCLLYHPYQERLKHAEDYELMMRLAHLYRFKYMDLPLTSYRRHDENLSNNLNAHRQAELEVLRQYDQAHIEKVVEDTHLNPDDKVLLKGKIFFNQEYFEKALDLFNRLDSAIAHFYAGNCHLKLNHAELALLNYSLSLQKESSNAACHNNLGIVHAWLGKQELAKTCFEKALQLRPGYLDAQYNSLHLSTTPRLLRSTWRELRPALLPYSFKKN